jgi:hypothetical protein
MLERRDLLSNSINLSSTVWTDIGPQPIVNGQVGVGGASPVSGTSGDVNAQDDLSLAQQGPQLGAVVPTVIPGGTGMVSGRITGLATDSTNANVIYADTAGGGVWQTTDGGNSWKPLTDNLTDSKGNPIPEFMGAIALAPSNPSVIYAGTGEADNSIDSGLGVGILKSTDGGSTWTLEQGNAGKNEFVGYGISQIAVDPQDPNTVYVAVSANPGNFGNAGIWKSTDGGSTWTNTTATPIGGTFDQWTGLVIDPTTTGGGATLWAADGNLGGSLALGVYKSTDGGGTWTFESAALQGFSAAFDLGRIALTVSHPAGAANPTLYAAVAHGTGFFGGTAALQFVESSADGGTTWTNLTSAPAKLLGTQGWYDIVIQADPNNPNVVYAGGQDGANSLIESTDGGASWTDISQGTPGNFGTHPNHHAMAVDANGALIDGNDGGVFRLDVNQPGSDVAWTDLNSNLEITQLNSAALDPNNDNRVYGGAQDNGTNIFFDNRGWTQTAQGNGGVVRVDPTTFGSSQVVYHTFFYNAADLNGNAFFERSADGGQTWTSAVSGITATDQGSFYPPFVMDPNNNQRLLLGTDRVYETLTGATPDANFGNNDWHALPTDLPTTANKTPITSIAIDPADSNTVLVSTSNSRLFVTHDDGVTWTDVTPFLLSPITNLAYDPNNANNVYATVARFGLGAGSGDVLQSTDGGKTWTSIFGNLPAGNQVHSVIVLPGASTVYVGTDVGVYSTKLNVVNGQVQWSRYQTGLPNAEVTDLEFANIGGFEPVLVAATYGRGAWEILAGDVLNVTFTLPDQTEGQTFSNATVATFTDPVNPGLPPGDYTATIKWGDGTTTPGMVVTSGSGFAVLGTHTYAEEGKDIVVVTVKGTDGAVGITGKRIAVADAPLNLVAFTPPSAYPINVPASVNLLTFQDTDPGGTATDYTATVTWGDGTSSTLTSANGGIVSNAGGTFSVFAGHTYAALGNYTLSVTVMDVGGSTLTESGTLAVVPPPIQIVSLTPPTATEGQSSAAMTLATFTDTNTNVTFTAIVNWGDSSTSTFTSGNGIVANPNGSFSIVGNHTYAEEGNYSFSVTINDSSNGLNGTAAAVTVADAPLHLVSFAPPSGFTEGIAATATVATFTDDDPAGTASDYTAVIAWGDGSTSSVTSGNGLVTNANGSFTVAAAHTYTEEGSYAFSIKILDVGGSAVSGTGTAIVSDAPLTATGLSFTSTEGATANAVVAHFTDGDPSATNAAIYTATLSWTDVNGSHTANGSVVYTGSGSAFDVQAGSAPLEEGNYTLSVVVQDKGGATSKVSSAASIADAALSGSPMTVTAIEGQTLGNGVLAQFTDSDTTNTGSDPQGDSGDYTATVSFTDPSGVSHTATAAVVYTGNGNTYNVVGGSSFSFSEEGNFTLSVQVQDRGGATVTLSSIAVVQDAPLSLTSTALTYNVNEGDTLNNALVATFTDTDATNAAADPQGDVNDYTASVTWDDGLGQSHTSTGRVVATGGNSYAVYADNVTPYLAGSNAVTVTLSDVGGASVTAADVVVAAAGTASSASGGSFSSTEGQSFSVTVGTYTNPTQPARAGAANTVSINWGDGTSSAGSLSLQSAGSYAVQGSHAYAQEGTYHVTFSVTAVNGGTVQAGATANVGDAALHMTSVSAPPTVLAGQPLNNVVVATFGDANSFASAGDYSASIAWGDGAVTGGSIRSDGNGSFSVLGSHTYGAISGGVISVTVHDAGGASTSGSAGGVSSHTPLFLGDIQSPATAPLNSGTALWAWIELLFFEEILLAMSGL